MKAKMKLSLLAFTVSLSLFVMGIYGQGVGKNRTGERFDVQSNSPTVSTSIVISQAYGGGGGSTGTYLHDYVELKNISASPQSLNGLVLMYGSATGQFGSSPGNTFALPDVTVNPGQYYLVQASAAGSAGAALPVAPDATTPNLNMSGTNGKLALVTSSFVANSCGATATPCSLPNPNIIDLVGWGTANNAEGGAATNGGVALTSTQGNVRKGNGCTDTDNNNADFEVVTAPVPRSSTSSGAPCGSGAVRDAPGDFNGDGKTDFSIVRPGPGDGAGTLTWWIKLNGPNTYSGTQWGFNSDFIVPADFDGDGKDDIAIWRSQSGNSGFWVIRSKDNTYSFAHIGQPGDDPLVVADYTGDGVDDPAIYRSGAGNGQSFFWYSPSSGPFVGQYAGLPWGMGGDTALFGDYNGDGVADFTVARVEGTASVVYTMFGTTDGSVGQTTSTTWGLPSDFYVPGDYDGDGKTDLAVTRWVGSSIRWIYRPSSGAPIAYIPWGSNATDLEAHGDYDGDGKTDLAVWRTSGTLAGYFIVRLSTGGVLYEHWGGLPNDAPTIWEFK